MIDWKLLESANAPLNAFVDWDERATGGDGPLAGMTIGIKSNIAVAGLPWTAGMELHRERIATRDAEVVARLRAAGAIILGSCNMEEAALGAKTDNPWFGATQNPHRLGYTPGGSSGGSAAAVAAGLCDAALGTDTMGSIRKPASYCGIYGFKPAQSAVSQDGLEPCEASLDVIGPLARDLDTLERIWDALCSCESRSLADGEPDSSLGLLLSQEHKAVAIADLGGVECTPEVLTAYNKARRALGAVAEIALPHPLARVRFAGFIMVARTMAAALADADPAKLSPRLKKLVAYGPRRSDADWAEDQRVLTETSAAFRAAVETHGAIVLPTSPAPAFPHSEDAPANQADFTGIANFAGLPAISVPGGWSDDGLPFGMQLIGRTGHEAALFALARRLDAALDAYRAPAGYDFIR